MESNEHLIRGTRAYRRARRCRRLARRTGDLLAIAAAMSPRDVYCGLLWYAQHRRSKDGWAAYAFLEIYGAWPRPQDRGEPVRPPIELEEWISTRPKRKKAKHG